MYRELAFKIYTEEISTGRRLILEWDEGETLEVEYNPNSPKGFDLACIEAILRYNDLTGGF